MSIRLASTSLISSNRLRNDVTRIIQVLVVGGGASGGAAGVRPAGGGGGGGVVEQTLGITLGTTYTVSVGAASSFSRFGNIVALRGGDGINGAATAASSQATGGGIHASSAATRLPSTCSIQGFSGGLGAAGFLAGGGGGAGAQGEDKISGTVSGAGGSGKSSSIPVNITTYGGGGGGGGKAAATATTPGAGGSGGGGGGSNGTTAATNGTANTGGGGGGGATESAGTPGTGGSGIVVIRFNSALKITIGAGLTSSTETSNSDTIVTFTAGTDTVSFS
jgi:hypothetical protein